MTLKKTKDIFDIIQFEIVKAIWLYFSYYKIH